MLVDKVAKTRRIITVEPETQDDPRVEPFMAEEVLLISFPGDPLRFITFTVTDRRVIGTIFPGMQIEVSIPALEPNAD